MVQIEQAGGKLLTPGTLNTFSNSYSTGTGSFNIGPNHPLRAFSDSQSAGVAPGQLAPSGEPSESVSLTPLGDRLAKATLDAAADNTNLKKRECYHYVKEGLASEGIELTGDKAYQAANQLARNPRFREAKVTRDQLADLPAGAVVVWNKNLKAKHPAGHISVALGDGREVSDRVRPQVQNYRSQYRVFEPVGGPAESTLMASDHKPTPGPDGSIVL